MTRLTDTISKGDGVVFAMAIILLASSFFMFWHRQGQGAEAVILVDGQRWARLSLFQNQDIHVPGPLGSSHIQVKDGQVRFINSPCPNKLCVHTGWIRQGGETATCLPNQVSLHILGEDARVDSINF